MIPPEIFVEGRRIPVTIVDYACPTIQSRTYWTMVTCENFEEKLCSQPPQRVLVTNTEPVAVALVYRTFPDIIIDFYDIHRQEFRLLVDGLRKRALKWMLVRKPDWRKEGF